MPNPNPYQCRIEGCGRPVRVKSRQLCAHCYRHLLNGTLGQPDRRTQNVPDGMRRCARCKQVLPRTAEHFTRHAGHSCGLSYTCHVCRREYVRNSRRKQRARYDTESMSDQAFLHLLSQRMVQHGILRTMDSRPNVTREERMDMQYETAVEFARAAGVRVGEDG